jgi:cystathionine beta-lyase
MSVDFDALTLAQLRRRTSAKWTAYPPDVLPAWVAEMDVPLAPAIRAALTAAIDNDDTGYANARGVVAPAFARFAARWFDWSVDPDLVFVGPDVLVALGEVIRAVTPPGGRVVVNSPVYAPFYVIIPEVGRVVENVALVREGAAWSLDFAALERAFAAGAHAYLLCSPHNPVGRVFTAAELTRVAELAQRYGVVVIADEIHAPLTYPGATHEPFLRLAAAAGFADAVGLWSASKAWNLAGLKCALIVAGSDVMRERLRAMPAELPFRAGHLGAIAATAAFDHGEAWLRELLAHLDRNRIMLRDLLAEALPSVAYAPPQASYLAWLDCAALGLAGDPSDTFLRRGRVALSRGRDFGGEGAACVRLNFATTAPILREVVDRMRRSLA